MSARSKFGWKILVNNKLKLPASNLENKIKILSFFVTSLKKKFQLNSRKQMKLGEHIELIVMALTTFIHSHSEFFTNNVTRKNKTTTAGWMRHRESQIEEVKIFFIDSK
jgi:hypothetical protein